MKMKVFDKEIHTGLLFSILCTALFGCIIIFSASQIISGDGIRNFAFKQFAFLLFTGGIAFVIFRINLKTITGMSWLLYFFSFGLLILVMVIGRSSHGAQRWIALGPIIIQPSEFAKLGIILALARYMSWNMEHKLKLRFIFFSCLIVFVPLGLIIKQPDLGTSMTLIPILTAMLFMAGIRKRYFLMLLPFALIPLVIVFLAKSGYISIEEIRKMLFFLKTYQQNRLLVFIDPNIDPRGMSYNLIQSQIAIGSGGMFGKGFMQGTQTHLQFLPERHTDFIFSVLGEEWGFVGGAVLIGLYFLCLHFSILIANVCEDFFCKLAATGIIVMLLFHVVTNMGMTIGLMPITGVPLPLISYGGSSLLTTIISTGFLLNFYANRHQTVFR